MPKRFRVFLDTSVILSGLNSPSGASAAILAAAHSGVFVPIISKQVIEEAERNILVKFSKLKNGWASFLIIPPEIAPDPLLKEIKAAYKIVPTSDATILAAAIKTKPDFLVTLDKRFVTESKNKIAFPVIAPGEFIKEIGK